MVLIQVWFLSHFQLNFVKCRFNTHHFQLVCQDTPSESDVFTPTSVSPGKTLCPQFGTDLPRGRSPPLGLRAPPVRDTAEVLAGLLWGPQLVMVSYWKLKLTFNNTY